MVVTACSWQGSIIYRQITLSATPVCCFLSMMLEKSPCCQVTGAPGGGICSAAEGWQCDRAELPSFAHLLKKSSVISFLQLSKGLNTSQSAYIPAGYASKLVQM